MRTSTLVLAAAAAAGAAAQDSQPLCDKYVTLLLTDNTAANQKALLTQLVNTVVIGTYPNSKAPNGTVPGILKDGEVNGEMVSLAKYFDGSLDSTNRNGQKASVNFLDGDGAEPLMNNLPAAEDKQDSNQYMLLNHLYQYFGALLGCTMMGNDDFPSYEGRHSMAAAHQFMDISANENLYFIGQVGAAASSFGVSDEDVKAVADTLVNTFNFRCSGPAKITGEQPELQAICQAEDCPIATESPVCDSYPNSDAAATPTPVPTENIGSGNGPTKTESGMPAASSGPAGAGAVYSASGAVGIVAALAAVVAF